MDALWKYFIKKLLSTFHVFLIKRLLAMCTSLFCYRNSYMQSDPCSMLPIEIEVSTHAWNHFQLITPSAMIVNLDINSGHVNGYVWKAVMYVHHTWILYRTELGLSFLHVRWHGMEYRYGCGSVGLGKPPSCEYYLKYLGNPYAINKWITLCINCVKGKSAIIKCMQ